MAVVGTGSAAERVVAYLAAAGVGWIAGDPALHDATDPATPDLRIARLGEATGALDAVVVTAPSVASVSDQVDAWRPGAATTLWIAEGVAGAFPPCPRCAADAATGVARSTMPELTALRDALLGTVIATETVKAVLAIGTPLAGRVLVYDPVSAVVTSLAATSAPACACARG